MTVNIPVIPSGDVVRLRRWMREIESTILRRLEQRALKAHRDDMLIVGLTEELPAATIDGDTITPGSVKATVLRRGAGSRTFVPKSNSKVLVNNKNTSSVPTGIYYAHREFITGLFFVLPEAITQQTIKIAKVVDNPIQAPGTGKVEVWRKASAGAQPAATGEFLNTVHHDWVHNSQSISVGKEVFVQKFEDEGGIWRITGAECEASS